jgi:hypothetical protein
VAPGATFPFKGEVRARIKLTESACESERRRGRAPAPAKLVGPAKSCPTARSEPRASLKSRGGFSAPHQLIGGELSDPSAKPLSPS